MALVEDAETKYLVEGQSDQYIHSEKLHLFIEDCLKKAKLKPDALQAIAVGAGPGSYTGLRIGLSAAKGLAYSLQVPLISARGPELLLAAALKNYDFPEDAFLHPMIDARRMEVYTADYNLRHRSLSEIEARIIDENAYAEEGQHYFFGDGAEKLQGVLQASNHHFLDLKWPSAAHFEDLLKAKWEAQDFEDIAYFEPFYLKDFVAIKPKSVF